MKKLKPLLKKLGWGLLLVMVVIQFIRPEKNLSAVPSSNKISDVFDTPLEVANAMHFACDDCHSNNSNYPWYTTIQPIAWWIDHHITDGKKHFNADEFAKYPPKKQHHKMEEFGEEIEKSAMPMDSYVMLHKEADLSPEQKQLLIDWSKGIMMQIETAHPEVLEEE